MRRVWVSGAGAARRAAAHIIAQLVLVPSLPRVPLRHSSRAFSTSAGGAPTHRKGGDNAKLLGNTTPLRVQLPDRDTLEVVEVQGLLVGHAKKAILNEFKQRFRDIDPDQVGLTFGGKTLDPTKTLKEVGVSGSSTVVVTILAALLPAMPKGKKFTLLVSRENAEGTMVPKGLSVSVDSMERLDKLKRDNGGGFLVLETDADAEDRDAVALEHPDQIKEGETYVLLGGLQEAVRRLRTWTQVSDKVMEEEALAAVIDAKLYGTMEEFEDYDTKTNEEKVLINRHHIVKEFDGIAVNGTHAVVLESKHRAEPKHVALAMAKAKHLQEVAAEGRIPRLSGIKTVVPVLAAKRFSPEVQRLCEELSVGIVKPNGKGLSFIHKPTVRQSTDASSVGTSN